jgi:hypothetical protein
MFSADKFHPSATGYARAADAMLPSAATALGYWPAEQDRRPDIRRGEGIDDIAHAAVRAVDSAGTEVAGIEVSGAERGPRGRWAAFRRLRRPATTDDPVTADGSGATDGPATTDGSGTTASPLAVPGSADASSTVDRSVKTDGSVADASPTAGSVASVGP